MPGQPSDSFRDVQRRALLTVCAVLAAYGTAGALWPDRLGVVRDRSLAIALLSLAVLVGWPGARWLRRRTPAERTALPAHRSGTLAPVRSEPLVAELHRVARLFPGYAPDLRPPLPAGRHDVAAAAVAMAHVPHALAVLGAARSDQQHAEDLRRSSVRWAAEIDRRLADGHDAGRDADTFLLALEEARTMLRLHRAAVESMRAEGRG